MSTTPKQEFQTTASDGTPIRFVIFGDPKAQNRAVLVHSLAMTAEFWELTAAALGSDWQVLAIDCRGHGASGKPAGPYTVDLFADDLASVMDDAKWDTAIVGGASMGGCVALAFAERYGARVKGLALFDTTAWYGEEAIANWETRGQKAVSDGMAALTGFQKTRWFSDEYNEENPGAVQDAIDIFTANDVTAYLETCRMLGRCDKRSALSRFDFPVEIAVGEEDYATPIVMAEALANAIPNASMEILKGARHLTPLEVPDSIAAAIRRLA